MTTTLSSPKSIVLRYFKGILVGSPSLQAFSCSIICWLSFTFHIRKSSTPDFLKAVRSSFSFWIFVCFLFKVKTKTDWSAHFFSLLTKRSPGFADRTDWSTVKSHISAFTGCFLQSFRSTASMISVTNFQLLVILRKLIGLEFACFSRLSTPTSTISIFRTVVS